MGGEEERRERVREAEREKVREREARAQGFCPLSSCARVCSHGGLPAASPCYTPGAAWVRERCQRTGHDRFRVTRSKPPCRFLSCGLTCAAGATTRSFSGSLRTSWTPPPMAFLLLPPTAFPPPTLPPGTRREARPGPRETPRSLGACSGGNAGLYDSLAPPTIVLALQCFKAALS